MKVIRQYPEDIDGRTAYKLANNSSYSMKDIDGSIIKPEAWILYEDVNSRGEDVEVLSILAAGEVYSTISETFKREFLKMVDYFGGDVGEINVFTGSTKAGRSYVTCSIV